MPSTHPLTGKELRELRKHQHESPTSPFMFVSERGTPLTAPGFSRMVERAGIAADLGIKVHAHMLRHATGFKLANDGHDTRSILAYMGHANVSELDLTAYSNLASTMLRLGAKLGLSQRAKDITETPPSPAEYFRYKQQLKANGASEPPVCP
jgi:integrase